MRRYAPPRAVVLGGGVIGAEFACLWWSLGSELTIIEALPRPLPNEDAFASQLIERPRRRCTTGPPWIQHGTLVAEDIAGLDPRPADESGIPRVTYSHPEVASVGLTEDAARERYGEIHSVTYDLGGNGRSPILQTSGGVKLAHR